VHICYLRQSTILVACCFADPNQAATSALILIDEARGVYEAEYESPDGHPEWRTSLPAHYRLVISRLHRGRILADQRPRFWRCSPDQDAFIRPRRMDGAAALLSPNSALVVMSSRCSRVEREAARSRPAADHDDVARRPARRGTGCPTRRSISMRDACYESRYTASRNASCEMQFGSIDGS